MASSGSPTVRRRWLAAELRRLRGNRTGGEVSRAIGWSPTKISRAESGRESLPPTEVQKLIDYYGVTDPLRGRLLGLAEDAVRRGWWDDYDDAQLRSISSSSASRPRRCHASNGTQTSSLACCKLRLTRGS